MLQSLSNGTKCIRCAYRIRISQFEQQRQRHIRHSTTRLGSISRFPAKSGSFTRKDSKRETRSYDNLGRENKNFNLDKRGRGSYNPLTNDQLDTAVKRICDEVKDEVRNSDLVREVTSKARPGEDPTSFRALWKEFSSRSGLMRNEDLRDSPFYVTRTGGSRNLVENTNLRDEVHRVLKSAGPEAAATRIKYAFQGYAAGTQFTTSDIKNQKNVADMRYPAEWFPATRYIQRTIHLHVGPTNSGKTYQALKRLEEAKRGAYAGPLRLLAHEVYSRLNAKGIPCHLMTGEERRESTLDLEDDSRTGIIACTVEMLSCNYTMDVAVIDEIQMIGSSERGWAWTQALLGVKAKEVHLCGEERTIPLIREICASVGDKLEIHRYKRLSPLEMAPKSLGGDLSQLRKGDCIVSFSVMGIHALRRQIEEKTGRKVATVYGSLPPETRAQQARLFNDPDNEYDFLVASDAIGMGLNLAIKRVIFEASSKYDGARNRTLSTADIKQIGGRAGRFRTALQVNEAPTDAQALAAAKGDEDMSRPGKAEKSNDDSVGLVTTLEDFDYPVVKTAMASEPEPILTAGIHPPALVLDRFASYFPPGTPFSYIVTRLHELSQMHRRFHMCGHRDIVWIADTIEHVKGLTISERNIICATPASSSDVQLWRKLLPAYARCVASQTAHTIVDIEELPIEVLELEPNASREYLRELERLHKGIVAWLWLSYRFAGVFGARPLAFHLKSLVEEKIEDTLNRFSFTERSRLRQQQMRRQSLLEDWKNQQEAEQAAEDLARASSEQRDEGTNVETGGVEAQSSDDLRGAGEPIESPEAREQREFVVRRDELDEHGKRQRHALENQSSVIFGGDKFGGEQDDMVLDEFAGIVGTAEASQPVQHTEQQPSSVQTSEPVPEAPEPGKREQRASAGG